MSFRFRKGYKLCCYFYDVDPMHVIHTLKKPPHWGQKAPFTGVKKHPHWGLKAPSLGSKSALTGVKKRPHWDQKAPSLGSKEANDWTIL